LWPIGIDSGDGNVLGCVYDRAGLMTATPEGIDDNMHGSAMRQVRFSPDIRR
jgi:hypothetical protein